jgi:hypothetical protein
MVPYPRVVERILAAVLLCAALLAPSLASAHAGHMHVDHAHHAPSTAVEPPAPPQVAERVAGEPAIAITVVRHEVARVAAPAGDRRASGCASHCCGGTANMTCCGAALIAEIIVVPAFTASHQLLFGHAGALLGLPPEALPKPPRPLA